MAVAGRIRPKPSYKDRSHARHRPAHRISPQCRPDGGLLRPAVLRPHPVQGSSTGGRPSKLHPVFATAIPVRRGVAFRPATKKKPEGTMLQGSIRVGVVGLVSATMHLLLAAGSATAQPTAEQQNALRSNCRSDFMSHCSGVTPGGAEALQCLQRNAAKLSAGCQGAVNALAPRPAPQQTTATPPPAPAATPAPAQPAAAMPVAAPATAARPGAPTPEQQAALRQFCGADYMAKCGNVPPATHQALQCLQSHSAELSENCRGALALFAPGGAPQAAPAQATPAPAAPARAAAPPPAPAARPAAAAPARPTAQQQAAIRQSCQGDFMSKCSGVQPGGADALRCLQRNSAQLSPNCRSAIAAIGGGAPAAAAPATAPAAMPTAEQQAAIKRTCQRDFMMNCRGVQPGGPEAFACLQRNASRLSPDCRTSLAAVAEGGTAPATAAAAPAARPAL